MQIFGDAWTWWEKATGKYDEGHAPKPGAVLVFRSQGKMSRGHVAVVSQIITDRYIQVTHANWSPINGRRGQVEDHVNVMDVSDNGDWSKVKVWYGPLNDLGTTVYSTYGFIYNAAKSGQDMGDQVRGRQMIAQNADRPAAQQLAMNDDDAQAPAVVPEELRAALTPTPERTHRARAVMAAASVNGHAASQIVAQIDADRAADKAADAQPHLRPYIRQQ